MLLNRKLCFFYTDIGCYSGSGVNYRGSARVTSSGVTCQSWSSQSPHKHFFSPLDFPQLTSHNFCRNPGAQEAAPWCYTTDPLLRKEECAIPRCGKNT